jgi:hypothetical protein
MNTDVPDNHDNKIIQFRPKTERMCPSDWETPYNPTHRELSLTIITLRECYYDCLKQLDMAGIQSETELRQKIKHMECMYAVLMDYYTVD